MNKNMMIDRHYYVRPDQDAALKQLASKLNTRPASLVREGIDMLLEKHHSSKDWKQITRNVKGLFKDDEDIEERMAEARQNFDRPINFE